jgi:cell division protein FtsQ
VFGTRERVAAKWAAAARVLAEQTAAGATYLDLRIPGRVAAGGLGPVPQEDPAAGTQP